MHVAPCATLNYFLVQIQVPKEIYVINTFVHIFLNKLSLGQSHPTFCFKYSNKMFCPHTFKNFIFLLYFFPLIKYI